jgi:hypothetical protein
VLLSSRPHEAGMVGLVSLGKVSSLGPNCLGSLPPEFGEGIPVFGFGESVDRLPVSARVFAW